VKAGANVKSYFQFTKKILEDDLLFPFQLNEK